MEIAYRQQGSIKEGVNIRPLQILRTLFVVLCALTGSVTFAADANLTDVQFSSQPGGRFEVRMDFDNTPPEPNWLATPARSIAILAGFSML